MDACSSCMPAGSCRAYCAAAGPAGAAAVAAPLAVASAAPPPFTTSPTILYLEYRRACQSRSESRSARLQSLRSSVRSAGWGRWAHQDRCMTTRPRHRSSGCKGAMRLVPASTVSHACTLQSLANKRAGNNSDLGCPPRSWAVAPPTCRIGRELGQRPRALPARKGVGAVGAVKGAACRAGLPWPSEGVVVIGGVWGVGM